MPCWHGEQRSCPCSHSICGGLGREWGPFSWGPFSETADSTPFVIITDIYLLKETNSDTSLYLLSVLPCSSALLLQSCAVFILFAKAFYFWPNQHRVVVVVEIRLFFFFFLISGFESCFTLARNKYRHSIVSLCNYCFSVQLFFFFFQDFRCVLCSMESISHSSLWNFVEHWSYLAQR